MSKFISLTGLSEFLTKCRALFYTKPSGGIPSSDLASAVQTSLGKADSAYQKPNSGIPASDLASSVQLQFADRAYNAQQPNGMGYKILRKGASFASQVTDINTIYEIRYQFSIVEGKVTIPSGCELRFNGGSVSGGVLNLNNALLSGDVNITSEPDMDETDESVEDYKPSNLILSVSWFGAKGDGLTDDAPAIQRTIKWSHKNGATVVFGDGTYILGDGISDDPTDTGKNKHTGYSYPADYPMLTNIWTGINDRQTFLETNPNDIGRNIVLDFFKFDNLRIEGNGAIIKSHDNNGYVRNNAMFRFWQCKGLTVLDLTVDANREGRMDIYQAPYWSDLTVGPSFVNSDDLFAARSLASYLSQDVTWGAYGVTLPRGKVAGTRLVYSITLTNCSDVLFDGVNSINGVVDGVAISSKENRRITIRRGKFAHNQRHGIWLGMCNDVTIDSCSFEYAGKKQDGETNMYMAGNTGACAHIDCENDSATLISRNNIISNSIFGESAKSGIVLSRSFEYSKFLHCEFSGSSIYSYRGRNCFGNEIAYCSFNNGAADAFHQEGMNFHDNNIKVTISDTSVHDFANYSLTYSDDYVKGAESGKASIIPSYFCHNIFRVEYASNITASSRNTSCRFRVSDNIVFRDNIFWNLDFSNSGSGSFTVASKEFSGNTFLFDTVSYGWLALNIYKTNVTGFSSRYEVRISNPQISQSFFDIQRNGSEKVIRICRTYTSATRYLILKNDLGASLIRLFTIGADTSAPELLREYYIHKQYSNSGNNKAIWVKDYYSKKESYAGGLRTDFSGVFELDTKVTLTGQYLFIEIHIPFAGSTPFEQELVSYQSGQYGFAGTVVSATDISQMQDSVPVLANRHRGQFNGTTVFDLSLGRLLVKKDASFVDVNGHPAAKSVGTTADRPSASVVGAGFTYFDTDLGKMIVSNGSAWVNMDGTALS